VRADVTDAAAMQRMVDTVAEEFGRIDAVVNNAFRPYAFDPDNRKRFDELDWTDYRDQVDSALQSTFNLCHAVLPVMKQRAQGSIVNIATDLVARAVVPYHEYTTAKSALVGFSRTLAAELGPLGIRVNCIAGRRDRSGPVPCLRVEPLHDRPDAICGWRAGYGIGFAPPDPSGPVSQGFRHVQDYRNQARYRDREPHSGP
jgi:enoyl-[acyl-carrier-protein] reductase (NADH)